jgi:hypothetical protein
MIAERERQKDRTAHWNVEQMNKTREREKGVEPNENRE